MSGNYDEDNDNDSMMMMMMRMMMVRMMMTRMMMMTMMMINRRNLAGLACSYNVQARIEQPGSKFLQRFDF